MTDQPLTTFDPDINRSTATARPYVVDVRTIYDTDDQLSRRDIEVLVTALRAHYGDLLDVGASAAERRHVQTLCERVSRPGSDVLIVESEG